MSFTIYALLDPRDELVRYVGCCYGNPAERFSQHMYNPLSIKKSNPGKWAWIEDLKTENETPRIEVLEKNLRATKEYDRERYWITHFIFDVDMPLLNKAKTERKNFYDISYYELYRQRGSVEAAS